MGVEILKTVEDALLLAHKYADDGEPDEGMTIVAQLLNEHPEDWRCLSVAAYICLKVERFGMAYNLLKRACELRPNKSELYNNLGMSSLGCMNLNAAELELKEALRINPENTAAMNNLALCYVNKCEAGFALHWAEKSLKINPNDDACLETKGYAHLMLGQWDPGWRCFEGGLMGKVRRPYRPHKEPYWTGGSVKTLLISGEQGIGDEISFASVISDAASRCERLIVECDKRLEGLFKRSFPYEIHGTRFSKENPGYEVDAYCLSGSLCQYFRLKDEDFPGTPYLVADPERRIQWRALLDSLGPKPKIGIAWTGGKHNTHRQRRSLRLEELLPILKQDCIFVSLQYKNPAEEIEALKERYGIDVKHWERGSQAQDYDDTAALVAELDLVISVQTAIVHLSGALGKECWAMIPREPLWRYKLHSDQMPWYKSVKLYRQRKDWAGLINKVADDLGRIGSLRA